MLKQASIFSMLDAITSQHGTVKSATADQTTTTMPDDPSGDGTTEPSTGPLYDEMSRDIKKSPNVEVNAETADAQSLTGSNQEANGGNFGTELFDMDSLIQEDYNQNIKDPGTSSPVKVSQYKQATFDQNYMMFNKLASLAIQEINNIKQASEQTNTSKYTREQKLAAIVHKANADGERLAANILKGRYKLATGLGDDEPVESMAELPPEVLAMAAGGDGADAAVLSDLAGAGEGNAAEAESALAEAIMSDPALVEEVVDELAEEILAETEAPAVAEEEAKLASYTRKIASDISEGDAELAAALEAAPPEVLEAIAQEVLPAIVAEEEASNTDAEQATEEEEKQAKKLAYYIHKLASDITGGDPEATAILETLPPEQVEAIVAEVAEEIAAEEAMANAPEPAGEEPSTEEALEALSSTLEEEQITPEDLEAVAAPEKQAYARKFASDLRHYRQHNPNWKPAKNAKAAKLRKQCRNFLRELMN
ncbi:MAG: hypothetical protein Q4D38_00075 [Planctomycetia bacterium]|nr:hypothetical protein [Planctomycetia bacterium]